MIGIGFALFFALALIGVLAGARELGNRRLLVVIVGGYVVRLVVQSFIRDVPLFSHGLGGDSVTYEMYASAIATEWQRSGIQFVTAAEFPELGPTSLPPNLFAGIIYLNGGETSRLGCTALVAFAAALTALNIYHFAVQFGAEKRTAILLAGLLTFEPAFFFYSCDSYKDALVVCLTIGAVGSAMRLAYRFSVIHIAVGVLCLWLLWYVRFYLIFVAVAPFLVGIAGVSSRNIARPLLASIALAIVVLSLGAFTDVLQLASERASNTFALATNEHVLDSNAEGGSGVLFEDDGVPYRALPQKLAYTLLSPFPWAGGSLGFHLGKLDAFIWYFLMFRAVQAARQVDRRLVLMLLTFVVPCTLMYAMSMSNVGLIVRQRLVIVIATGLLAALYKPQPKSSKAALAPARRRVIPRREVA